MYINLTELFSQTTSDVKLDKVLPYAEVAFGGEVYTVSEPAKVTMTLTKLDDQDYLATGHITTTLVIPCGRCTVDVISDVKAEFSKELKGVVLDGEDEDLGEYLQGNLFDLEKFVLDEVYMNVPMKVLCNEDCQGICKSCGKNLNVAACDCEDDNVDPRLAGLKDLFNDRFKEV